MRKRIFHITIQLKKFSVLMGALLLLTSRGIFAQSHSLIINNGASFKGNGKIVVKDSIKSNSNVVGLKITGTVILNGGAQSLVVNAGGGSLMFDVLSIRGNGEKQITGTIAVVESLNIHNGVTLTVEDDTLRIGRLSQNNGGVTGNERTVIEYMQSDGTEQTMMAGTFKGKIRILGNSRKRLGGPLTVDSIDHSGWGITLNHHLTVNGKAQLDSIVNIASGTLVQFASDSSIVNWIGNIESGAQLRATNAALTIHSVVANSGIIKGGTRQLTFVNSLLLNGGTIEAGSGDVTFNSGVTLGGTALITSSNATDSLAFKAGVSFTSSAAQVQLNGTGVASFTVTPQIQTASNVNLSEESLVYYSGGNQSVLALQYGSLALVNSGTKQFESGEIRIRGSLLKDSQTTVDATTNNTTINYNGAGAQKITPLRYANLMISGDRGNQPITLLSHDTIKVSGVFTVSASNYTVVNTNSTFEYNGFTQQVVTPFAYNNLVLSGAGEKVIAANQTTTGTVEQKEGTSVTVLSNVSWSIEGSLIAHQGFVNNGTITLGGE
ncbi:MAG: hypothetical protein N3A63_09045 [Bacteroidetes bacterium]|nr:hypothetical protein [Bacteroidota bacterium]